ncbi:hypothetical protein [Fimbriiglobus ruber]|uniref:Uncharacterized protein n=1 Tax=Fimbriiglobus ruber TaxID=1908690 RepID=A0A225CZL2_9BACT|nr:hypothetical protein [Fimbriiglobus ruber]OWK34781.1 hypothetical protein FRUB_09623 [Fimbriiglobus ruber]
MFLGTAGSVLAVVMSVLPAGHWHVSVETKVFDTKTHHAVLSLDVSADVRTLIGSEEYGRLFLIDIPTKRVTKAPHEVPANDVCLSKSRQLVFFGGHIGADGRECLAVYDILKQQVVGEVRLGTHIKSVRRGDDGHILCLTGDDEVICVDVSDPVRPTVRGPRLTNVYDLKTDDRMRAAVLFKNGTFLVTDGKELRFTSPDLKITVPTKNVQVFGLAQDETRRVAYCDSNRVYLEVEGRSGRQVLVDRPDSKSVGVYAWGADWVICRTAEILVLDSRLRVKEEISVRVKESGDIATASAFTVVNDAAVVVIGKDDGKVVLFTLRRAAKK